MTQTITEQERFQLSGNAAGIYERQKVPAIFAPLARATFERVAVRTGDRLLDVACGTGIVARHAVPRQMEPGPPGRIEWHEADICDLPFDDDWFDIAVCQQGLQYFPDKAAAFLEVRRVLVPGGQLVLTVWSAVSPLFEAIAGALERHIGPDVAARALAPFAFRDGDIIRGLVGNAGFTRIRSRNLQLVRVLAPAETSIPEEIRSSPYADELAGADPASMDRNVEETASALSAYRQGPGFSVPQWAHLFEADVVK